MFGNSNYKIFRRERLGYDYFAPVGTWRPDFLDVMRRKRIKGLRLSQSFRWRDENIDFLPSIEGLRGVDIFNWKLRDLSPIANLTGLEALSVDCLSRSPIDLAEFENLKYLSFDFRSKISGYEKCGSISDLSVTGFPDEDLHRLRDMIGIEKIKLSSRKLKSLGGLANFKNLRSIELTLCPSLSDISEIDRCPMLDTIYIWTCRNINELPMNIGRLPLSKVHLNNIGGIKSLTPLMGAKRLETLWFVENTNVEDGNLGWMTHMPRLTDIRFQQRRHYDITWKHLK